jgi:effector-binding domain-containing protein
MSMGYGVTVKRVEALTIAAARGRMTAREIPGRFKEHLDKVWEFLVRHPELRGWGHNVFLYRHDMDAAGAMTIDFGVQVVRAFEAEGDIFSTSTPAGEAATTVHVGPYSGLPAAHAAVHAWLKENGRKPAGWSWEIYGDWNEDPGKLETGIFYLVE